MTSVVATFRLTKGMSEAVVRKLGASYTMLGVRRIWFDESVPSISMEYDATRMDELGVAALLRQLGVPIGEPITGR